MESAEARHVLFWQPKTVFKIKFDDKFTQISSQMDHLTKSHVFVQTMAWCRTGEKPLSEPIIAWCNDRYTVKCRYNTVQ